MTCLSSKADHDSHFSSSVQFPIFLFPSATNLAEKRLKFCVTKCRVPHELWCNWNIRTNKTLKQNKIVGDNDFRLGSSAKMFSRICDTATFSFFRKKSPKSLTYFLRLPRGPVRQLLPEWISSAGHLVVPIPASQIKPAKQLIQPTQCTSTHSLIYFPIVISACFPLR